MAKTAFSANVAYLNNYTVPGGKYAIFNVFGSAINMLINGQPLYTGFGASTGTAQVYDSNGPFVAAAGDIIAVQAVVRGGVTTGTNPFGICGFLYDTSVVKIPFTSVIIQNSTSYTVPAGKLAVFNAYVTTIAELTINGIPIAGISNALFTQTPGGTIQGPFVANASDIITAGNTFFPTTTGQFTINGFLYPP
jgi:hypothetical protein